jgi:hypothetical protein
MATGLPCRKVLAVRVDSVSRDVGQLGDNLDSQSRRSLLSACLIMAARVFLVRRPTSPIGLLEYLHGDLCREDGGINGRH